MLLALIGCLVSLYVLEAGAPDTPENRAMEEFCGLSAVPVNRNRKFVMVADSSKWTQGDKCSVTMTSLLKEKLYIAFSAYDVTDCGVKVNLYWGNKHGQKEFTCKKEPDLFKTYHHGNDSTLTITISGAESPKEKYYFTYEITSNKKTLAERVPVTTLTTPPSHAPTLSPFSSLHVLATIIYVFTYLRIACPL